VPATSTPRTAIVTGAARGIGAATAKRLAADGHRVAVLDLDAASCAETVAAITDAGGQAIGVGVDVADADQVAAAVAQVAEALGAPTILVNNAGITRDNLAMRMKDEDWQMVIDVNLTAGFRLARGAMRGMMKKRWGRIIGITSVVGVTGNPGQANYAAAKAGMIGMSKSLAQEVASRNITVNCVAPGFIETQMTGALNEDQKARIMTAIPAGRLGQSDEIAAAVVYLASPEAAYVTGQTIHVNGGMAMI